MTLYALLAVSCFVKLFLVGVQTKNVQLSRLGAAFVTSLLITVADVILIRVIAEGAFVTVLLISAIFNSTGIVAAIWVHDRYMTEGTEGMRGPITRALQRAKAAGEKGETT